MNRIRRRHGDFHKFIFLALIKEGPLNLEELKRMTSIMISQFEIIGLQFRTRIISNFLSKFGRPEAIRSSKSKREKDEPEVDINSECQKLLEEDLIQLNNSEMYELTEKGEEQAREFEKNLKKEKKYPTKKKKFTRKKNFVG